MTDTNARLARVLANIARPGPIDDVPERDCEPEPYSQRQMDERADEAADRHEKEMDDRW